MCPTTVQCLEASAVHKDVKMKYCQELNRVFRNVQGGSNMTGTVCV
jgi:hypothetical protein